MAAALTIVGNTNDALAAIARLERSVEGLENKLKRVNDTSRKGGDVFGKMSSDAANIAQQTTGIASGWDIINKTLGLAIKNMQEFEREQNNALNANRNFVQSLTKLALSTDTPLPQAQAQMIKLAKDNNLDLKDLPSLLNRGQAAKGPTQGPEVVDQSIAAAAKLARHDPESMGQLIETALDITKQIPNTTQEQAMGFSLAAQSNSRVADPMMFNKNVMPAVLGANKISGTPLEQGSATNDALTHGSGDATGKRTATAQIGLEMQLGEMLPEFKTFRERVEAIRDDPGLRDAIMHGKEHKGRSFKGIQTEFTGPDGQKINMEGDRLTGERRMMPAVEAYLTRGSAEEKIEKETLRKLPTLANSEAVYNARAEAIANNKNFQTADQDRKLKNEAAFKRINNTTGANSAAIREGVSDNNAADQLPWTTQFRFNRSREFREHVLRQSGEEANRNTLSEFETRALNSAISPFNTKESTEYYSRQATSLRNTRELIGTPPVEKPQTLEEVDAKGMKAWNDLRNEKNSDKPDAAHIKELEKQTEHLAQIRKALVSRTLRPNGNTEPH